MRGQAMVLMLHGEPGIRYLVYPSWAALSYRWEQLPRLLADPLASGYLNAKEDWKSLGFTDEPIPFTLIDGPCGGGILRVECGDKRWLPGAILTKEACWRVPVGIPDPTKLAFRVSYLEPRDDPFMDFLEGKPRAKIYVCAATPEHIESDPDAQYWVIDATKGKRRLPGLDDLPDWAAWFGQRITPLAECPAHVRAETADWFRNPTADFYWYRVENESSKAGECYAMVLYLALHLRQAAGKRMCAMHLLSGIEGQPQQRKNWFRR